MNRKTYDEGIISGHLDQLGFKLKYTINFVQNVVKHFKENKKITLRINSENGYSDIRFFCRCMKSLVRYICTNVISIEL